MKKMNYSDGEQVLLKILRNRRTPIATHDLTTKYYELRSIPEPFHARNAVIAAVRQLQRKCLYNGESFEIVTSDPRGRNQIEISLVEKSDATNKAR